MITNVWCRDLGIDMGSKRTRIWRAGEGLILEEESVAAVQVEDGKPVAFGTEAVKLLTDFKSEVLPVRPVEHGMICDVDVAAAMLKYFVWKANQGTFLRRVRAVVGVPAEIDPVHRLALQECVRSAGIRDVRFMSAPVAAAKGAGLDISKPEGQAVVHVGAGIVEIAVLSLEGIVCKETLPVGGCQMDGEIIRYVRDRYGMEIGSAVAEQLKNASGMDESRIEVGGRDIRTGLPAKRHLEKGEIRLALRISTARISKALRMVLNQAPPELSGDILLNGLLITGGGARLNGLAELLQQEVMIPVACADKPELCVVRGLGYVAQEIFTSRMHLRHERNMGSVTAQALYGSSAK